MTMILRAVAAALLLLGVAACGSSPSDTGTSPAPATSAPAAASDAGTASYPAPDYQVLPPASYPAPSGSQ